MVTIWQWTDMYILGINLMTFIAFSADKWRAEHGAWRIRERTLLFLSALGGAAGGYLAMYMFRHKIRKWKFRLGLPLWIFIHGFLYLLLR